jgi:hypothetical protein
MNTTTEQREMAHTRHTIDGTLLLLTPSRLWLGCQVGKAVTLLLDVHSLLQEQRAPNDDLITRQQ